MSHQRILVYAVGATEGGALSILKAFYRKAQQDTSGAEYFFVVGDGLEGSDGRVAIFRFPSLKRSKLLRLCCEYFYFPFLLRRWQITEVISLQNRLLPFFRGKQTMYLQNCLPFVDLKVDFFRERSLWINKHITGILTRRCTKSADRLLVQTQWVKQLCVLHGCAPDRIEVSLPTVCVPDRKFREDPAAYRRFFYPASAHSYKNHRVILEACRLLAARGIADYEVHFTITGDETSLAAEMKDLALQEKLPIRFDGPLPQERVFEKYCESVLLFPSTVETCGLPMLEARRCGTPILAADSPVSREVLAGYGRAEFFSAGEPAKLAQLMARSIDSGKSA